MDLFETQTLASITANLLQTTARAIPTFEETEPTAAMTTTSTTTLSSEMDPSYKDDERSYAAATGVSDAQELQSLTFGNLSNTLEDT